MKLNLGCGTDVQPGYVNVDLRHLPGVDQVMDLSKLPWTFPEGSVDEILMLDFLEHFPYKQSIPIINECWRLLKVGGSLVIQVPDLEHCARAASDMRPFLCNNCGWEFPVQDYRANFFQCGKCAQPWTVCAAEGVRRLYGGQDYEGNWHQAAFSKLYLDRILQSHGFSAPVELEKEHQHINWNFKVQAFKIEDLWG